MQGRVVGTQRSGKGTPGTTSPAPTAKGLSGSVGTTVHPEWVELNIASGGFTLNNGAAVAAFVNAPSGTITINSNCVLTGRIIADRLTVNGTGVLADPEF